MSGWIYNFTNYLMVQSEDFPFRMLRLTDDILFIHTGARLTDDQILFGAMNFGIYGRKLCCEIISENGTITQYDNSAKFSDYYE